MPRSTRGKVAPVLLTVDSLEVHWGHVHAVRGVSFEIARGETLGLVGESGCGKSSLARALVQLVKPSKGSVRFEDPKRKLQLVFQDPKAALDPRLTVQATLEEPLEIAGLELKRVPALLDAVGLGAELLPRRPHELSAGQRQRINIARALAVEPTLLVLDEPVSALDVSVQAQVLNLLVELQKSRGLTYLFISHDLAVVSHIATRIAVMQEGRIVELGPAEQVIVTPQHAYTKTLLDAAARLAL
ncbi:MAG: ABC transporter ATP-binding protein [Myxococcaceae bacterium]|nr:ABC transporter ATP-binding protein [Myxococcaceae bacterium]